MELLARLFNKHKKTELKEDLAQDEYEVHNKTNDEPEMDLNKEDKVNVMQLTANSFDKMIPLYKEKCSTFYEAHKHELSEDEYDLLVRQFVEFASGIDVSYWRSEDDKIVALYDWEGFVYHDETGSIFKSRYLKRYTGDVTGLNWEKESEWPCEEQAVLYDEHTYDEDPYGMGYESLDRHEILLRGLCHMSGVWIVGSCNSMGRR